MGYYGNSDEYWAKKKAARSEDKQLWESRNALEKEKTMGGITDESGPIGEGKAEIDWLGNSNMTQNEGYEEQIAGVKATSPEMAGAAGVQNAMANGGSPLDMAGSGMTSAGMMSANPYLIGGGLAVSSLSAINKGKNQRDQNRYLAEVQKYNARQSSIEKLAQIGQGLKA